MAKFVVSYDIERPNDKQAEYNRTRQALVDAIEVHANVKVLESVYFVSADQTAEQLRDTITAATGVALKLSGQPGVPYKLAVIPRSPGACFYGVSAQIVTALNNLP